MARLEVKNGRRFYFKCCDNICCSGSILTQRIAPAGSWQWDIAAALMKRQSGVSRGDARLPSRRCLVSRQRGRRNAECVRLDVGQAKESSTAWLKCRRGSKRPTNLAATDGVRLCDGENTKETRLKEEKRKMGGISTNRRGLLCFMRFHILLFLICCVERPRSP